MAQLPYLFYDQKPSMSSGAFKELARPLLNRKDASLLENLSLDPDFVTNKQEDDADIEKVLLKLQKKTGCKFIDNWNEWERALRLNLARYRSKKINRDAGEQPGLQPVYYPAALKDASAVASVVINNEGNPLEDEIFLDRERWATIDSLTGNDYFSRDNVFAYYLKILLLERHQLFNAETGFAEYKSLYSEIIESPHEYINNGIDNSGHNSTGEHK